MADPDFLERWKRAFFRDSKFLQLLPEEEREALGEELFQAGVEVVFPRLKPPAV